MPTCTPNLWFDHAGLEAAEFYAATIPNTRITNVVMVPTGGRGEPDQPLVVDLEIDGRPFTFINGGPSYTLDEAFSIRLDCADQVEADSFWDALLADGGEPGQCGWLKDRFGVSWQVVPGGLIELLTDPDPVRSSAANQAMFAMQRLDLDEMRAAVERAVAAGS
ncbi:MAG: VOC family protein [Ilumatobacteraceae bacterium]